MYCHSDCGKRRDDLIEPTSRYDGGLFAKPVGKVKESRWLFDWQSRSANRRVPHRPDGGVG